MSGGSGRRGEDFEGADQSSLLPQKEEFGNSLLLNYQEEIIVNSRGVVNQRAAILP
jgi:hypothetical protein